MDKKTMKDILKLSRQGCSSEEIARSLKLTGKDVVDLLLELCSDPIEKEWHECEGDSEDKISTNKILISDGSENEYVKQTKNIKNYGKCACELFPEHNLNYDDFVYIYYQIVTKIILLAKKARTEGLLSLEDDMEVMGERDIFKIGLQLVVDGTDAEPIHNILSNLVESEYDPYKKKLMRVQMEGILCIGSADKSPRILMPTLDSVVQIEDSRYRSAFTAYINGDNDAFNRLLELSTEAPNEEREEVRFIKRAMEILYLKQEEGLLAIEEEIDQELVMKRDIFEYGLYLVVNYDDSSFVSKILENLIEHEIDPVRKRLCRAKKYAVLSILKGEQLYGMYVTLSSFFDELQQKEFKEVKKELDEFVDKLDKTENS
jgi:flagellar motor component MotA